MGFVSAYVPPGVTDRTGGQAGGTGARLFVWQVAVDDRARGRGLATGMLLSLLRRPVCRSVRYLETTIGPSNHASRGLFERLAQRLGVRCERLPFFPRDLFADQSHEQEDLYRLGPIDTSRLPSLTLEHRLEHRKETVLS